MECGIVYFQIDFKWECGWKMRQGRKSMKEVGVCAWECVDVRVCARGGESGGVRERCDVTMWINLSNVILAEIIIPQRIYACPWVLFLFAQSCPPSPASPTLAVTLLFIYGQQSGDCSGEGGIRGLNDSGKNTIIKELKNELKKDTFKMRQNREPRNKFTLIWSIHL